MYGKLRATHFSGTYIKKLNVNQFYEQVNISTVRGPFEGAKLKSVNHSTSTDDIIGIVFSSFCNMMVCCVFSLALLCRGDSYECIKKIPL